MAALFDLNDTVKSDPAIASWWTGKPPETSAIARKWFEVMRHCGEDVLEVLHDHAPTVCVGRFPFAYVNAFKSHVNVGFFYGAFLPDPNRLIEGTGKRMRHVKIIPGREPGNDELNALINVAYIDIQERILGKDG